MDSRLEMFIIEVFRTTDDPYEIDDHLSNERIALQLITQLFSEADQFLDDIPDNYLAAGLDHIANGIYSNHFFSLSNVSIPQSERLACGESIFVLFEYLLTRKGKKLSNIIYMWWDVFPWEGSQKRADMVSIDQCLLNVMNKQLRLDVGEMCASAVHGLNHWHREYPEDVIAILDRFILGTGKLTKNLREQIEWAKMGSMQ